MKLYSCFLNIQEANRWRESAIAAAATTSSTATAATTNGSIARQLHAEQS